MGLPVLIYGKSGSGKSRSMKFFGEDEILLLNTERKELPFRKRFKSTGFSDDPDKIIDWAKRCGKKVVVIDDAGYIMTHLFMANHRIKKGNAQFDMYNDIADVMYSIVQRIKKELPVDGELIRKIPDQLHNCRLKLVRRIQIIYVCSPRIGTYQVIPVHVPYHQP